MGFKNILSKVRRVFLCNKSERKPSLDIVSIPITTSFTSNNKLKRRGFCHLKHYTQRKKTLTTLKGHPTNVRRVDISDALPGLTDTERKYIREKASSDAIHLLGLQSHPPTSPPSPTESTTPSLKPASREPSEALLNAASKDLPSTLPTPPRRTHNENSPPAVRLQTMRTHPETNLISQIDSLKSSQPKPDTKINESFMTLNLEFDWEEKKDLPDTPRTLSLCGDGEGFETQSTTGGTSAANSPVAATKMGPFAGAKGGHVVSVTAKKAVDSSFGDSSDSEVEAYELTQRSPLVGKV